MGVKDKIKGNPKLKKLAIWALTPNRQPRPRTWVKLFVNPFKHKRGKHSVVRKRTRMDVFPWNNFVLGSNSTIEDFATINNGVGDIIIGNNTRIGLGNTLIGPVTVGNNVIFAQNIVCSGLNHGYEDIHTPPKDQPTVSKPILIEDEVWIGANTTVVAGVTIGKHAVIAAGSVVTKSVPPFSVAAGNPARILKQYNRESGQWERVK
ncbi:MAG: acyltransferase [Bacteroidales bacterium]|nr:acyltransferase [Bacteroidales bacterium]